MASRFIIFTLARTGSTTLQRLLNQQPGVKVLFEPFSPSNRAGFTGHIDVLRHSHGLEAALSWLWGACNGIKHVWHWDGFPFPDQIGLNGELIRVAARTGVRLVLLTRKNLLRRAISVQISEQMQMWTPTTADHYRKIREHQYLPLDIAKLEIELIGGQQADTWTRENVRSSGAAFCEIAYEDFLDERLPADRRMAVIHQLLEFIAAGTPDTETTAKMQSLLKPDVTGFQNAAAYTRIPNIDEVEKLLGSDQTGHALEL